MIARLKTQYLPMLDMVSMFRHPTTRNVKESLERVYLKSFCKVGNNKPYSIFLTLEDSELTGCPSSSSYFAYTLTQLGGGMRSAFRRDTNHSADIVDNYLCISQAKVIPY